MNTIIRFLTSLSAVTERIGICANVGLIAGAFAGVILTLLDLMLGGLIVDNREAVLLALILAGFTWVVVLFILCALVRFTIRSVALPALLTCLLTCLLLVFVCKWLGAFTVAWLIGIVVGILVGLVLCWLNAYLFASKGLR